MLHWKPHAARLAAHLLAVLVGASDAVTAQSWPQIDPQVKVDVLQGRTRVIVELRLPDGTRPVGIAAIAAAQDGVIRRLAGTDFVLLRRFATQPLLVLEIGPTALAALEAMGDAVSRVVADTVGGPADRAP